MDIQNLIVAGIIFAACLYIGQMIWRKINAFSVKSACGSDCGCAAAKTGHKLSKLSNPR